MEESRMNLLISATNEMMKAAMLSYRHLLESVDIEPELSESLFFSDNLPVFQSSSASSAYAWTPCVQSPRVIYLNANFILQLNHAADFFETLRITFLFSTVICHEVAHYLIRCKYDVRSPISVTREGHSGYFIESFLHGGKISQVRNAQGRCIGMVLRDLTTFRDTSSKPEYKKQYSDNFFLKWHKNLINQGKLALDLTDDDLVEFNPPNLNPGEYIERKSNDEPDIIPIPSSQRDRTTTLHPGEYIEERECGTHTSPNKKRCESVQQSAGLAIKH
jgi:hypothetical protein